MRALIGSIDTALALNGLHEDGASAALFDDSCCALQVLVDGSYCTRQDWQEGSPVLHLRSAACMVSDCGRDYAMMVKATLTEGIRCLILNICVCERGRREGGVRIQFGYRSGMNI